MQSSSTTSSRVHSMFIVNDCHWYRSQPTLPRENFSSYFSSVLKTLFNEPSPPPPTLPPSRKWDSIASYSYYFALLNCCRASKRFREENRWCLISFDLPDDTLIFLSRARVFYATTRTNLVYFFSILFLDNTRDYGSISIVHKRTRSIMWWKNKNFDYLQNVSENYSQTLVINCIQIYLKILLLHVSISPWWILISGKSNFPTLSKSLNFFS